MSESAAEEPDPQEQSIDVEAAVEFARLVGELKTTPRTGWVRREVPKYESVADHSWRVAVLSLLLDNKSFDIPKCMAMGLVHDLAESITGDYCPADNVTKEDKQRMEEEAIQRIATTLDRSKGVHDSKASESQILVNLFREYESRETREAVAVKDLDLLDMIMQADEYEDRFGMDLSEFFDGTPVSRFRSEEIKRIAHQVHEERSVRRQRSQDTNKGSSTVSNADAAFAEEYSKASTLSRNDIEQVVRALRQWESSNT